MKKVLMSGNDAIVEGAIRAGLDCYFGYPITPQNEITAGMAVRMPEIGRVFLQSESELAAISMVHGAAAAGVRTMTSSSSPGIALMQEGISYIAGSRLPCVIVNIQRGGPGLGNIAAAQGDYWQSTRGGGNGDYRTVVLAPSTAQEMMDFTFQAFDLADQYCVPVLVLGDGRLGQMMEPVVLRDPERRKLKNAKPWALTGAKGRAPNIVKSLRLPIPELKEHNDRLQAVYREIGKKEVRFEEYRVKDAQLVLVGYGTCARLCREVVDLLREKGVRVGMFRPITLWPFPSQRIAALAGKVARLMVVEMSAGQMLDDVRLAVEGRTPIEFLGTMGGDVPTVRQLQAAVEKAAKKRLASRNKARKGKQ